MVRKKLAVMVAALGAFQADVVSALGMGHVSLNSALNQPLNAEIRLLNTNDLDSTQVRISLADPAAFKRSGVERDFFLSNIDFSVQLDGFGSGVVKLTTREPVVEPFLNFLVETRWPSGRLLREYTVLLDLPVFSEAAPAVIDQATSAQSESLPERAATAASTNTIASARRADNALAAGTDYRVQNDDTLWKIAKGSRVRADQSVQQVMVSLQRINPEAFVKGNINRLKSGAVLRLPTETEIDKVVERKAVQEVANQNKVWKRGGPVAAATDGQLDATDRSQS
ncbi:MAG: pilus assembly protein FimV, partial [Paraglaciecola psychrophila]